MNAWRSVAAVLAGMLLLPCLSAAEEPLGRLFLTPQRRALLEQQRQLNLQEQKTIEGSSIRLDGVVVRSTGKKTIWLNGQAQHDNRNELGVEARVAATNPNRARLTAGNESFTDLRVGQKINRATQKISDGLDGGRIELKPAPLRP